MAVDTKEVVEREEEGAAARELQCGVYRGELYDYD